MPRKASEALSEGPLAAAGSLITRPEILTRALLAEGAAEQKAHWLPRLAAGAPLCAIAMAEPDYGFDLAACQHISKRSCWAFIRAGLAPEEFFCRPEPPANA